MKLGIIGAGAIGLTFAAALANAHDVVVLARRSTVAEQIAREGIAIERGGELGHVGVVASVDSHVLADRDAVLVAVKAYATREALTPLRNVFDARMLVASVQNGLDNVAEARRALPDARIVAGATTQGAISRGTARVRPVNRGTTVFARSDKSGTTSDELVAAFTAAGLDAAVTDAIETLLWSKLIVNAAINPLGALTGATNGAVGTDPDLQALARALALEAAAVATAEGVEVSEPWQAVETAARETASNLNSMLQDIQAGRRTEIEQISGAVVDRAAAHRVAVPLTETMLRLVRARERS